MIRMKWNASDCDLRFMHPENHFKCNLNAYNMGMDVFICVGCRKMKCKTTQCYRHDIISFLFFSIVLQMFRVLDVGHLLAIHDRKDDIEHSNSGDARFYSNYRMHLFYRLNKFDRNWKDELHFDFISLECLLASFIIFKIYSNTRYLMNVKSIIDKCFDFKFEMLLRKLLHSYTYTHFIYVVNVIDSWMKKETLLFGL